MNRSFYIFSLVFLFFFVNCTSEDVDILPQEETPIEPPLETPVVTSTYFPPMTSNTWETSSIADLNWNANQLQPLLDYLETKNSKSFIILHKGKIVVEHYFDGHTETSPWYWASAGKTLTTAVAGIAQEENLINLNAKVSDYIGTGWTSASLEKENLITCKNLLSMTSGLDDGLGDGIAPNDLQYVADAGTRWAYHGVFVKMQDVIASASNETWDTYFNTKLKNSIGMTGAWIQTGNANVYWSTTRSMARFGLLISASGKWNEAQIVPENFLAEATSTTQNINEAYGYLWWINGKTTYRLPQTQLEFSGELVPNAPQDMYCALGKNDQKIYIVPSKDLVVIRMGNAADDINFALSDFDNVLWEKINLLTN
ncbi:serine hydrolase domain-containing protein [Kordia jejudonensis]|uniref:serine hydrolase domain-containing protein n=1 Tax=Kordia jejudonensis TaxID=1348245 RepID=UPI0006299A0D|nr:serine hydrolase [Kordia jejudonensis]